MSNSIKMRWRSRKLHEGGWKLRKLERDRVSVCTCSCVCLAGGGSPLADANGACRAGQIMPSNAHINTHIHREGWIVEPHCFPSPPYPLSHSVCPVLSPIFHFFSCLHLHLYSALSCHCQQLLFFPCLSNNNLQIYAHKCSSQSKLRRKKLRPIYSFNYY